MNYSDSNDVSRARFRAEMQQRAEDDRVEKVIRRYIRLEKAGASQADLDAVFDAPAPRVIVGTFEEG